MPLSKVLTRYSPPDFHEIITSARHEPFNRILCVTNERAGLEIRTPADCIAADLHAIIIQTLHCILCVTNERAGLEIRTPADCIAANLHTIIIQTLHCTWCTKQFTSECHVLLHCNTPYTLTVIGIPQLTSQ